MASQPLTQAPQLLPQWPSWWKEAKLAAWQTYLQTPAPTRKNEDWRFANIQALDFESYQLNLPISPTCKEDISVYGSDHLFNCAGFALFANDELLGLTSVQQQELESQGVIWEALEVAIQKHPDLVKRYFMKQAVALGSEKFAALHQAHCRSGMFIYIPKGVEVALPLVTHHWLVGENACCFPHTLIVAEAQSKVVVVDFFRSFQLLPSHHYLRNVYPDSANTTGMACGVNDLYVGANASVTYIACQRWNKKTLSLQLNSTQVEHSGYAKSLFANFGGAYSRIESKSVLLGNGSKSEMLGITLGDGQQEFDHRTLQQHVGEHTWSDLLYKNVLHGSSKSIFKGLIRVEPKAAQTDAYQTNRNLLLGANAEADIMPGLEILNDNVKCSHGATSGQLDEAQLFYMRTRGISTTAAKRLLSLAFFEETVGRLKQPAIAQALHHQIEEKFASLQPEEVQLLAPQVSVEETNLHQLQGTK